MQRMVHGAVVWVVLAVVALGCASPGSGGTAPTGQAPGQSNRGSSGAAPAAQTPATPKRLVAAIQGSPSIVYQPQALTDRPRGIDELTLMVNSGLSVFDTTG